MARTDSEKAAYLDGYRNGARMMKGKVGIQLKDLEHPAVTKAWAEMLAVIEMLRKATA